MNCKNCGHYLVCRNIKFEDTNCLSFVPEDAFDKEMPRKPKITIHNVFCPRCDFAFGQERVKQEAMTDFRYFGYCSNCGQALDWSDTE